MSEAQEQAEVFKWAAEMEPFYPDLQWMFHCPNGGSRHPLEAVNLKRQGVKPGVPDVWLPVPRGRFCGMVFEMKYGRNKPTKDQEAWLRMLKKNGWAVFIFWSAAEAEKKIIEYLELKV